MSHTKIKTTYGIESGFGSTETVELYCHHNHTTDHTTFYNRDGSITQMSFAEWTVGDDLWHAMNRLWFPFKDKWGGELKDNVQFYHKGPWEGNNKLKPTKK